MEKGALTRVNKILRQAGREERVVRGRGYYYLHGGTAHTFHMSGIYSAPSTFKGLLECVQAIYKQEEIVVNWEK